MELRFGARKGLLGLTMFADCGFQAPLQGVGLILGLVRTSGGLLSGGVTGIQFETVYNGAGDTYPARTSADLHDDIF